MKFNFYLFLLAIFSSGTLFASTKPITCHIKGRIENRASKAIFLMKATTDPRSNSMVRIPIVNNEFDYKLTVVEQEAYQLIFEEELEAMAYKPVILFPDTSEIRLTLYPNSEADDKNLVIGGLLNQSYTKFMADLSSTFKSAYLAVRQKRRAAIANGTYYKIDSLSRNHTDLSPVGITISAEERNIIEGMYNSRYSYVKQHANSVSYYMIYDDFHNHREDPYISKLVIAAYNHLSKAIPQHPYHIVMANFINGFKLQKGDQFIDFSAPDLKGKSHQLSSTMKGKITLLNLWASWCGPCISKTREVLPLYTDFKDKGFEVIGVAREFKDLAGLKTALDREKHPWLTLVELEDKQLIWNKYGLDRSGGGMVLFDRQGKILAINPTVDELKKMLIETL